MTCDPWAPYEQCTVHLEHAQAIHAAIIAEHFRRIGHAEWIMEIEKMWTIPAAGITPQLEDAS